jgi:esterase/lipase
MEGLALALDLPLAQCHFIRLPGHGTDESFRNINAQQWVDSFDEQYAADSQNTNKIIFIGFSLGGLLMTHLLGSSKISAPQKQILLAPALAFKAWSYLPSYFPSVLNNLMIPAYTPKKYKAHIGVTISAYKALFEIRDKLELMDAEKYNIPTLVMCDQHDELVNPQGLQKFIEQKKLTRWQLQIFRSSPWKQLGRKHLMMAREYRSDAYWNHLKASIDAFLHE